MDKKILVRLGGLLLIFVLIISFFGIIKPSFIDNKDSNQNKNTNLLKIAIVNEDNGTKYNGETVNIANTLIKSFIKSSDYNVEEVTRNIAEKGLENNTYQLMIILPSKFSEESLALESVNPTKVNFQYKIKTDKPVISRQAEQAVTMLKSKFNKDLIRVYFSSIIGNLQSSQDYVSDIVENNGLVLNTYKTKLLDPLNSYSKSFEGLGTNSNNLLSNYSLFDKLLNQSNESFSSIINTNKTYDEEIQRIKLLQEGWTKSVTDREHNLKAYDESFSKLSVYEQLSKLKKVNEHISNNFINSSVWKETVERANKFNEQLKGLVQKLKSLNGEIDNTLDKYDKTIANAVEESIKKVEGKLLDSGKVDMTLGLYLKNLRNKMISKIDDTLYKNTYYTDEAINKLGLPEEDTQYLKNINSFIKWYVKSNGKKDPTFKNSTNIGKYLMDLRDDAINTLSENKVLSFRDIKGKISKLYITVPKNYTLNVKNYSAKKVDDTTYEVSVPNDVGTSVDISYNLSVADKSKIGLLESASLKGELITQENVEVLTGKEELTTKKEKKTIQINPQKNIEVEVETKTIKPQTNSKIIERKYNVSDDISPFKSYDNKASINAFFKDIKGYLGLSSLANAFYDIDLHKGFVKNDENSLLKQADIKSLKTIIISLIKESTINALKSDLKISDKEISEFEKKTINGKELADSIESLKKDTEDLMTNLKSVLVETEKVHNSLLNKPAFTESEKKDNTDLVNVAMEMNKDLSTLITASRTLMDNTKANQAISKDIENTVEKLNKDVDNLEKEGKSLSTKVSELGEVMSKEYSSNEEFLKSFASVLSNTKVGNKKNEAVYEYLSNPVNASKIKDLVDANLDKENIRKQDNSLGLIIILMSYLVGLSITYLLQHSNIAMLQRQLQIYKRIQFRNSIAPMMFLTIFAGIAGIIIGMMSSYKLGMNFNGSFMLSLSIIAILLIFTYGTNIILSKLKSFGFVLCVMILLLYILSSNQLLEDNMNFARMITMFSPLNYSENAISGFISRSGRNTLVLLTLWIIGITLGFLNILIYRTLKEDKEIV